LTGSGALLGLVGCSLALAAGGAGAPSTLVPAGREGFPGWLAGPLSGLGLSPSAARFQALLVAMCACYAVVLACVAVLDFRVLVGAIVGAHIVFLLGPPLLSADVFGYLDFARLGTLHGLDPYTHVAADAPRDAAFGLLGWQHVSSPYGPVFTLLSYALVPLGVAGGYWALKSIAVLASLATLALLGRAARRLGLAPLRVAAFVGLNPLVLVFELGGAHNDALLVLVVAGALTLALSERPGAGALATVGAVGIKASAGLLAPFLILGARARGRTLAATVAGVVLLVAVAVVGFGTHASAILDALRGQQQLVAVHSIPAQVGRLLGQSRPSGALRSVFAIGFVGVMGVALWRVWRGADWLLAAGWSTLALLVSTAWLLPWYVVWLLPLAALSGDRRLRAGTLALCAYLVLTRLELAQPLLGAVA